VTVGEAGPGAFGSSASSHVAAPGLRPRRDQRALGHRQAHGRGGAQAGPGAPGARPGGRVGRPPRHAGAGQRAGLL